MAKSRNSRRKSRRQRRRGGSLQGAPLNYSLAGDVASRASLSQGADYFKYHEGQHGGQAPLSAITDSATSNAMLSGPARLNGLNQAFADIAGLQDGGRRRRRGSRRGSKRRGSKRRGSKRGSKHCGGKRRGSRRGSKRRGSRRGSKRRGSKRCGGTRRHQGGSLGYATFPSQGMLLSGAQYSQAGLNPGWKDNVEFDAATIRGSQ